MEQSVFHPIEPIYNAQSRVLILGSFPSRKSREEMFYYAHPQNRFWRVLSLVFDCSMPKTPEEKTAFLLSHKIALWDVIASCRIVSSSDSSICDVIPNDLMPILSASRIERIFVNGKTAEKFYCRYSEEQTGRKALYLPSTSPANAAWSLERLVGEWKKLADF